AKRAATVDVMWSGGIKNRIYNVKRNRTLRLPEIPCSYDADVSFREHFVCVAKSLRKLRKAGVINRVESARLKVGQLRAYIEYH
ncbi:MAG: hypothetical protein AAFY60_10120, partial [Myxococcota bacterium]